MKSNIYDIAFKLTDNLKPKLGSAQVYIHSYLSDKLNNDISGVKYLGEGDGISYKFKLNSEWEYSDILNEFKKIPEFIEIEYPERDTKINPLPELSEDDVMELSNRMRVINRAINNDITSLKNTFKRWLEVGKDDFIKLLPYINERLQDRYDYDKIKDQLTKILKEAENEIKMNKNFSRIDKVLSKYNRNFSSINKILNKHKTFSNYNKAIYNKDQGKIYYRDEGNHMGLLELVEGNMFESGYENGYVNDDDPLNIFYQGPSGKILKNDDEIDFIKK